MLVIINKWQEVSQLFSTMLLRSHSIIKDGCWYYSYFTVTTVLFGWVAQVKEAVEFNENSIKGKKKETLVPHLLLITWAVLNRSRGWSGPPFLLWNCGGEGGDQDPPWLLCTVVIRVTGGDSGNCVPNTLITLKLVQMTEFAPCALDVCPRVSEYSFPWCLSGTHQGMPANSWSLRNNPKSSLNPSSHTPLKSLLFSGPHSLLVQELINDFASYHSLRTYLHFQ